MNITTKIIITDTNIITDLNNANILEHFINLENVFISDVIKNDEIITKTGNLNIIKNMKVVSASIEQLEEVNRLSQIEKKLSTYDLLNFVLAKDNDYILATGDNRLKKFAESQGVEVFRTLKIIKLMKENNIISLKKAIDACVLLKQCPTTRIPELDINDLINELTQKEASYLTYL